MIPLVLAREQQASSSAACAASATSQATFLGRNVTPPPPDSDSDTESIAALEAALKKMAIENEHVDLLKKKKAATAEAPKLHMPLAQKMPSSAKIEKKATNHFQDQKKRNPWGLNPVLRQAKIGLTPQLIKPRITLTDQLEPYLPMTLHTFPTAAVKVLQIIFDATNRFSKNSLPYLWRVKLEAIGSFVCPKHMISKIVIKKQLSMEDLKYFNSCFPKLEVFKNHHRYFIVK